MKMRTRRKIPTVTHAGISIREVRKDYFMVDIFRDGKRERKCFDDMAPAKTYCEILGTKIKNEGTSALNLTPNQRSDATSALAILKGAATLKTAASFWARHNAIGEGVTLKDLGDRFIKAIRVAGCRETTIAEREQKIDRLVKDLGDRPACNLTKDMLIEWLDEHKLTGVTRDGYKRCYHAVFEYALTQKIVEYNPVHKMEGAFKSDEKLPMPLTVEAVQSIMAAAEKYAPLMVLPLAVQFFGGLRPGEAKGLRWEDVNFIEKTIRVLPETSKMRRSRYIELNETLIAWLTRYRKTSGPIGITTQCQFSYYMARKICDGKNGLLAAAGIQWIQDGPRKTYASMHFATYQDGPQLAAILGHTGNQNILFRHYRGLVKKTEGLKFWQIVPEEKNTMQEAVSA
jgi:integrase